MPPRTETRAAAAGWSVWHEVMLVRDRNGPMVPTDERPQLGQLLIKKAKEGVRVLILQCAPWPL